MEGVGDAELRIIQSYLLDMLIDVDKVMRESNVPYNLDGGTVIGAIRHKGFIPWDDDVDIMIYGEDEDAFLRAVEKLPKEKYSLIKPFSLDWPFTFYKIKLNGTEAIEVDQGAARIHRGLSIDVFVYRDFPMSFIRKKIYYLFMFFNRGIERMYRLCYGKKRLDPFQSFLRCILKANYKIIGMTPEKNTGKTLCYVSFLPKNIEYDKERIRDRVEVKFEGHRFFTFGDYDYYLRTLYGDYMQLPPEDKRKRHILSFRVLDDGRESGNEDDS